MDKSVLQEKHGEIASGVEKYVPKWHLERLRVPFSLLLGIIGVLTLGEQVYEHYLRDPSFAAITGRGVLRRLVMPGLAVYMAAVARSLHRMSLRTLAKLRRSVQIDEQTYKRMAMAMLHTPLRTWISLASAAALTVLLLFVVLQKPLPMLGPLPRTPIGATYILASYALFGWLGLVLVHSGLKHARTLGSLARKPLRINVFDPDNLLPFGDLSLAHSLALVGIILILILGLGVPTSVTAFVPLLLSTTASVMALILPIWGVNRQIGAAKEKALNQIYRQLEVMQRHLSGEGASEPEMEIGELHHRTAALVSLRKLIHEAPSWPFRDSTTIARAILAAISPLIYFVLTELTRSYLLPLLGS
jgi:hypothetical protein